MANENSFQIGLPDESDLRLTDGRAYITWEGQTYTHITDDQEVALCGASDPSKYPIVTLEPFGKPRCPECLKLANIEKVSGEPEPPNC